MRFLQEVLLLAEGEVTALSPALWMLPLPGGHRVQLELLAQVGLGKGVQRPAILDQQAPRGVAGFGEVDPWSHQPLP